jgi:O-antigen ligase
MLRAATPTAREHASSDDGRPVLAGHAVSAVAPRSVPPSPIPRQFGDMAMVGALALGVIAVALIALPYKLFELDRYFVPKELVLNLVAVCGAVWLFAGRRTLRIDAADAFIGVFVAWSILSSLFADNLWLAQRALGVSLSSAVIFWTSRRLGAGGWYRPLLAAAALATVTAAALSLAQAYGFASNYFSLNRAPGGTFGNRNFVAHFAAIGLPALIYMTVTARQAVWRFVGSIGAGAVIAALVLTRSRAAWLAVIAAAAAAAVPLLVSRQYWRGHAIGWRFVRLIAGGAVAAVAAIAVPNRLNWRSDSPYLESARGLVDYTSGSGQGRLEQYRNSLRITAANPVLGVGPGNWPVHYPRFAPRNDRSLSSDGMAANPWPSSDWVAHFSERGVLATLALLGVFASLALGALLRWRELGTPDAVLAKVALLGTLTGTFVVSAFDAVLLLPAPAFLAWCVLGASSGIGRRGRDVTLSRWGRAVAVLAVCLVVVSLVRSVMQTAALASVGRGGMRAGWNRAAVWDPGSYRINLRVAELHASAGRCGAARPFARRAAMLFPHASAPRQLLRRCG